MTSKFEIMNQQRNHCRAGYLLALAAFVLIWVTRNALQLSGRGEEILADILLALMFVCLTVQTYFVVKEVRLKQAMKQDPALRAMMNDELVRLNELKAWRMAFLALIGYMCLVTLLSLAVELPEIGRVMVTGLLVGFGSYSTCAYWLNR
jgi:hypothetical protein